MFHYSLPYSLYSNFHDLFLIPRPAKQFLVSATLQDAWSKRVCMLLILLDSHFSSFSIYLRYHHNQETSIFFFFFVIISTLIFKAGLNIFLFLSPLKCLSLLLSQFSFGISNFPTVNSLMILLLMHLCLPRT